MVIDVTPIQEWFINGKPYEQGVLYYLQFGRNDHLKRLFQRKKDDYNVAKLAIELKLILDRYKAEIPKKKSIAVAPLPPRSIHPNTTEKVERERVEKEHKGLKAKYPVVFHPYIEELKQCYARRNYLHAVIKVEKSKIRRKEMAEMIVAKHQRIFKIFRGLDYWDKYNVVHPEFSEAAPVKDVMDLQKKRMTLRTYVSRYKKYLEKNENPSMKAEYENKKERYEKELQAVEIELGVK